LKFIASSLAFVATIVAGCSSSSTTDLPGIEQVGIVNIEEFQPFSDLSRSEINVVAAFLSVNDSVLRAEFEQALQDVGQESCTVTERQDTDASGLFEGSEPLSAGDVITLSSATGTYGELVKSERTVPSDVIVYLPSTPLPFPVPERLIINIPGDAFPAFSDIEIAAAPRLSGQNLTIGSDLTASTIATWDVDTEGGEMIGLDAEIATDDDGGLLTLACRINDDGSFTLPASTVSEIDDLLGSGWVLQVTFHDRVSVLNLRSGNVLLTVDRRRSTVL